MRARLQDVPQLSQRLDVLRGQPTGKCYQGVRCTGVGQLANQPGVPTWMRTWEDLTESVVDEVRSTIGRVTEARMSERHMGHNGGGPSSSHCSSRPRVGMSLTVRAPLRAHVNNPRSRPF